MDFSNNDNQAWDDIMQLVDRFNNMLSNHKQAYFDIDEFDMLIDFFLAHFAYSKCEQVVNYALKQYPENLLFLLRKAAIFSLTSREKQAVNLLKRVEKIEPDNPEVFLTKASAFSNLDKHQNAIEEYTKALNLSDDSLDKSEIYIDIATEFNYLKDNDNAYKYLMKAILLNSENDFAITKLIYFCELEDDYDKAIDVLNNFLEEHPFSYIAWFGLGNIYMSMTLYTKAIEVFDYALAINPDYVMAYFFKAKCYTYIEKYNKAIDIYNELLEIEPSTDGVTLNSIGECYESLDKPHIARKYFKKAFKIAPFNTEAIINLSYNYLYNDEPQKAIKLIVDVDENIFIYPELYYIKAQALFVLKKYEEAIENYKRLVELDFDDFNMWIDYADAVEAYKGSEKAEKILEKGIRKHPDCSSLQYRIAACKYKSDKILSGLLCLYKAMSTDLTDIDLFFEYMPELKNNSDVLRLIGIINKIK